MASAPASSDATSQLAANAARMYEPGEQEFSSVFEHAPIGMSLIAPDLRRLRVNRAFCRMLGYSEAELLQRTLREITHPDDVEADLVLRAALIAGTQEVYEREKRYLHKDGQLLWGHVTCSLVRDKAGRPLYFISQVQDITARRQSEDALRESEERFRSLTQLSADWYWEQDEQFRFKSFSGEAMADAWRIDQQYAIGRARWELEGVTALDGSWEEHRAMLAAHQPFRDFQYKRVVERDEPRFISASGEPVFDSQGHFKGYRGTARDITSSHLAEQQLRDTQALLHLAAQIGRLGGWAWELGQPRVFWSPEVCAIHDVRPGFMPTPEQALTFFAPQYREMMSSIISACIRDGSPFEVEAQIVTGKGRRLWVRVICEAEWDEQGKVRRIQGACQDISDSKRAAEQNRLMAEQLTLTLESLTDAFFTVDRSLCFTYVNAKAERLLRMQRSQVLGKGVFDVVADLRGSDVQEHLERALAENLVVQYDREYAPLRMWVQIKVFPSRQGLAIYVRDVTQRVMAERENLRLNAELEERVRTRTAQLQAANQELEAFSYSIAHDLRAPLSSIDGFSQMLQESAGAALPERSNHYLARIRAGVRQMGELTDGLLSLATYSRAPLRCEPVDLASLARTSIAALRERAPQRHVQVQVAASLPVRGDPRLLAQVMNNLLGNAWKFTARTPQAHIEVGCELDADGAVVYHVRDDGVGFDMTHAARMFEAFQRMHSTNEFEGTGIGLAIVHKIVVRHGGRIWADSAPGRGATFRFTLGDAPA